MNAFYEHHRNSNQVQLSLLYRTSVEGSDFSRLSSPNRAGLLLHLPVDIPGQPEGVRISPYFPFSARVCLHQHHWLANRLRQVGIDFS
jgi:hypothetical protein